MTLEILGAGFGRTGTMSLLLALEQLGCGPCHHMKEVITNPEQTALWDDVADGKPDFTKIFANYQSAVDFPVAAYWQDVLKENPDAKVILSTRSAASWYDSFSQTILPLILNREQRPQNAKPWLEMVDRVIIQHALGGRINRDGIIDAFNENEAAAKRIVPADQLLIFDVRQGWKPLCEFLGKEIPVEQFPRSNARDDFAGAVKAGMEMYAA